MIFDLTMIFLLYIVRLVQAWSKYQFLLWNPVSNLGRYVAPNNQAPPPKKMDSPQKMIFFLEVSCDFRGGSENRFHVIFCNEKYFLDLKNFSKKKILIFFLFLRKFDLEP